MENAIKYRLAVAFAENDANYKIALQKQIDELNMKMVEQKHEIEVVEINQDNIEESLADGAINGVMYFSECRKLEEYGSALKELIEFQNGIDVFPINHSRESKQKDLAKDESEYIQSINESANVYPAIKVDNQNELNAAVNVMNIGIQSSLAPMDKVQKDVTEKSNALRDYVVEATGGKHEYTAGHVSRVSIYAKAIAEKMGYEGEKLEQLSLSAQLHDIGKLGIEDGILASNKNLTFRERQEMEYHTILGPEILRAVVRKDPELGKRITKDVIEGVEQHHKTWDGKPKNDKDPLIEPNHDDINEFALIICVADCLDTMTSQRAYNNPKNIKNAMKDLWSNRDKMFRADIAETGLLVIAEQLVQLGFDASELFDVKKESNDSKIDPKSDINKEIKKFFEVNNEKINRKTITEKGYCDLGFRLDAKGHFEFENGPKYDENKSKQNEVNFWKGRMAENELGKGTKFGMLSKEQQNKFILMAENKINNIFIKDEIDMREGLDRAKTLNIAKFSKALQEITITNLKETANIVQGIDKGKDEQTRENKEDMIQE